MKKNPQNSEGIEQTFKKLENDFNKRLRIKN